MGQPDVVAIQKGDQIPAGSPDAGIARRARPLIFLRDELDTVTRETLDDGARGIGGTVIDDDEFIDGPRLRKYAGNRVADECLAVIGGDDRTHAGMI